MLDREMQKVMRLGVFLLGCMLWSGERCNANNNKSAWFQNNANLFSVYDGFWPSAGVAAANTVMENANCSGTPSACVFTNYPLYAAYTQMYLLGQALTALGWGWNPPIPTLTLVGPINATCTFNFGDLLTSLSPSGPSNYITLKSNIKSLPSLLSTADINNLVTIYTNFIGPPASIPSLTPASTALGDVAIAYGTAATAMRKLYITIESALAPMASLYSSTVGGTLTVPTPTSPIFSPTDLNAFTNAWPTLQTAYTAMVNAMSPWVTDVNTLCAALGISTQAVPTIPAISSTFTLANLQALITAWAAIQTNYAKIIAAWPALSQLETLYKNFTGESLSIPPLPESISTFSGANLQALITAWPSIQRAYAAALAAFSPVLQSNSALAELYPIFNISGAETFWTSFASVTATCSPTNIQQLTKAVGLAATAYTDLYTILAQAITPSLNALSPSILANNVPLPTLSGNAQFSQTNVATVTNAATALVSACQTLVTNYPTSAISNYQAVYQQMPPTVTLTPTVPGAPSAANPITVANLSALITAWTNLQTFYTTFHSTLSNYYPLAVNTPLAFSLPTGTNILSQLSQMLILWHTLQANYASTLQLLASLLEPQNMATLQQLYTAAGGNTLVPPNGPFTTTNLTLLISFWNALQGGYPTLDNVVSAWTTDVNTFCEAVDLPPLPVPPATTFSVTNLQTLLPAWSAIEPHYQQFLLKLPTLITNLTTACTNAGSPAPNSPAAPPHLVSPSDLAAMITTWTSLENTYATALSKLTALWTPLKQLYTIAPVGGLPTEPGNTLSLDNVSLTNTAWTNIQMAYAKILTQLTGLWKPLQQLSTAMAPATSTSLGTLTPLPGTETTPSPSNITGLITAWPSAQPVYGNILSLLGTLQGGLQTIYTDMDAGTLSMALPAATGTTPSTPSTANVATMNIAWTNLGPPYTTILSKLTALWADLQQLSTALGQGNLPALPGGNTTISTANIAAIIKAWSGAQAIYGNIVGVLNSWQGPLQTASATMGIILPSITLPGTTLSPANVATFTNALGVAQSAYTAILGPYTNLANLVYPVAPLYNGSTLPTLSATISLANIQALTIAWDSIQNWYKNYVKTFRLIQKNITGNIKTDLTTLQNWATRALAKDPTNAKKCFFNNGNGNLCFPFYPDKN